MSLFKGKSFSASDYAALGISICLAFVVWLLHGLSQTYSDVVKCQVTVQCELDGHSNVSEHPAALAARCEMSGFSLVSYKVHDRKVTVNVSPEDMHRMGGDNFYMTSSDLTKYFYDIFSDNARLEYFATDTVNFFFSSVMCKKVPVRPSCTLDFAPQYIAVGPVRLTPDSVLVYGTKDRLDAVQAVNTKAFHLSGLKVDTFGEVGVEPVRNIRVSAQRINYSVAVSRYVEQVFTLPVVMEGTPARTNVVIFPSTTTLRVKCVFPSSSDLKLGHVKVSYSDFASGVSGKCLGYMDDLPSGVIDYSMEPELFDCIIQN